MCQWSISHKIGVRYKKNNWGLPNLPKLHSLRLVPKFYLANSCQRQDVQIKRWYICIMHESAPVVWFPACLILAINSCQVGEPDSSLWTFHLWDRFSFKSTFSFSIANFTVTCLSVSHSRRDISTYLNNLTMKTIYFLNACHQGWPPWPPGPPGPH